ncbi:hypothetical protein ANCCAN_01580 [Ancylostoma caninum]|uniref:SXP/RAL-2 family protein Ani s 5-like cation-binding domain-containing protein n=1 Tax=Ancylostoma caninum TaxID=29170 RepID=A0A368H9X0_ANCCA|nr:hypothetical protein ANCCAN_01580 [Ancylostoma caninum]
MFRSAVFLSLLFVLKAHYAAAAANASADASAAIPGIGNIAANLDGAVGALPDIEGTVANLTDVVKGASANIAKGIPIAGPVLQQILGTVFGLFGAVLGLAHQLPLPAANASIQAST